MNNSLAKLITVLGLTIPLAFGACSLASAQSSTFDGANDQSNEKDGLFGDSTLGINPLDLIHEYNLRNGRSSAEFGEESGTQIQDSAAEFRRLQQERILEQTQGNSEVLD